MEISTVSELLTEYNLSHQICDSYIKLSSPFREDNHPSMCIYPEKQLVLDYGGDYTGDIWSFLQEVSQLETSSVPFVKKPKKVKEKIEIEYNHNYKVEAQRFLVSRGLPVEFYDQYGMQTAYFGEEKKICFPLVNGYEVRTLGTWVPKAYTMRENRDKPSWFFYDNPKSDTVVVTEGIIDALTVSLVLPHVKLLATLSNHFSANHAVAIMDYSNIIVIPDNDTAGRKILNGVVSSGLTFTSIDLPQGIKDCNEAGYTVLREVLQFFV